MQHVFADHAPLEAGVRQDLVDDPGAEDRSDGTANPALPVGTANDPHRAWIVRAADFGRSLGGHRSPVRVRNVAAPSSRTPRSPIARPARGALERTSVLRRIADLR